MEYGISLLLSDLEMNFCFLILSTFFFWASHAAYISAIDSTCPFRTGTIYIIYPDQSTRLGTFTITHDLVLTPSPSAVALSLRSLECFDNTSSYIDFSFLAHTVTSSGFNIDARVNQISTLNYTKIILSYWANSPLPRLNYFSPIPATPTVLSSGGYLYYTWRFQDSGLINGGSTVFDGCSFIVELKANFVNRIFQTLRTAFTYETSPPGFTAEYRFTSATTITSIKLAAIIYDYYYFNHLNYSLLLEPISIVLNQTSEMSDTYIFATMMIGIESFEGYSVSNKFGFTFGYSSEDPQSNSLLARQTNLPSNRTFTQSTSPTLTFYAAFVYFKRKSCSIDTTHIYLEQPAQLCHDKCPLRKYADANKLCLKCTNCQNEASCKQCYSNGCDQGYFYKTTILPYTCNICNSSLANCLACFANSTASPYCTKCQDQFFIKSSNKKCYQCNTTIPNCQSCAFEGTVCLNCRVSSSTELVNGTCRACNNTSFYSSNDRKCHSCNAAISDCESCTTVTCLSCLTSSQTQLINGSCHPCNSTSYYKFTDRKCYPCSALIENCESCSSDGTVCFSCLIASSTQLVGSRCEACLRTQYYLQQDRKCYACGDEIEYCVSCEFRISVVCLNCSLSDHAQLLNSSYCGLCNETSFYDEDQMVCRLCSNFIPNCQRCSINAESILQCSVCDHSTNHYLEQNTCSHCEDSSYLNLTAQTCTVCHQFCLTCLSQIVCSECYSTPDANYKLESDTCVQCNSNFSQLSPLPYCFQMPVTCTFSTYNPDTNKCQFSGISEAFMQGFGMIASVPTLSVLYKETSLLLNFLDDLSFYTYHSRAYANQVQIFFQQLMNFTITRFVPFQLDAIYSKILVSYNGLILTQSLNKTPPQYLSNDGSIYFLTTTEDVWISTLVCLVLIFILMMFVHWVLNKCIKTNVLKSYSYFGMIFVSLFSSNVQYLSFRCFSQLFQTVPLGFYYYLNLILCYTVLFFIVIYSVGAIIIFKAFYQKIDLAYLLESIFNQPFEVRVHISSIVRIGAGFIHAYFYYHPFIQTTLLTFKILIQAMIFTFGAKYSTNKLEVCFEIAKNYLFLFLQLLFFIEILLMTWLEYTIQSLAYFGSLECIVIFSLILINLVGVIVLTVKSVVEYIINKFSPKKVNNIQARINKSGKVSLDSKNRPQDKKQPSRLSLKPLFAARHQFERQRSTPKQLIKKHTEEELNINSFSSKQNQRLLRSLSKYSLNADLKHPKRESSSTNTSQNSNTPFNHR